MKVLHINSYYSTSRFYKNLYEIQKERENFKTDVFVPVSNYFLESNFNFGEYTIISKNYNKFDRIIFHLKAYKILKDIQKKYDIEKYDILHAHSLFSNGVIAWKLYKKYNIPYVVAVRNTDLNIFFKKMIHLRKLGINILKDSKKIIFLSKSYEENIIKNYIPKKFRKKIQEKSTVIPNGVDNFWIENKNKIKTIKNTKEINLLYVGEINKNKNLLTTVKAIEYLIKEGYKVNYSVVGKASNQKILKKIEQYDFVNYLGIKTKEKLLEIYRDNDIFIMPSFTETFGLVYVEAMTQGLPIVYSKGQGFDRQFKDGTVGYSVLSNNSEEILIVIKKILKKYNLISEKAIRLSTNFDWNIIEEKYFNIYIKINKLKK